MSRKDLNQTAFSIVQQATDAIELAPIPNPGRKLSATEIAARVKGGKARAERLTSTDKKAIATQGAASRWNRTSANLPQSGVTEDESNPVELETKAKRRIVF